MSLFRSRSIILPQPRIKFSRPNSLAKLHQRSQNRILIPRKIHHKNHTKDKKIDYSIKKHVTSKFLISISGFSRFAKHRKSARRTRLQIVASARSDRRGPNDEAEPARLVPVAADSEDSVLAAVVPAGPPSAAERGAQQPGLQRAAERDGEATERTRWSGALRGLERFRFLHEPAGTGRFPGR